MDLHSGVFGGAVANPAAALARMLASLHDSNGHIAVDGFYDEVRRGWFRALRRRSQRRLTWDRFNQWLARFPLPRAGIVHTREALPC